MHSFRTEGIIIKRRDLGEADRILTVLTRHQGKINVIAKGVRKINSRRSPHVELLNHSVLNIHQGKLPILTEAETVCHYSTLKNDLKRASYAFYICEILDGLVAEHQDSKAVFDIANKYLTRLEATDDPKMLVSKFQQDILITLGFWPRKQALIHDSDRFIEDIIERRIKSRRILKLI